MATESFDEKVVVTDPEMVEMMKRDIEGEWYKEDDEIQEKVKKGLKCCAASSFTIGCKSCPYFGDCHSIAGTGKQLHKGTLALINRLEEENADKERYTIELYNRAREAEREINKWKQVFVELDKFGSMTTPIGLLPINAEGMRQLVDYCGQIRKETAIALIEELEYYSSYENTDLKGGISCLKQYVHEKYSVEVE